MINNKSNDVSEKNDESEKLDWMDKLGIAASPILLLATLHLAGVNLGWFNTAFNALGLSNGEDQGLDDLTMRPSADLLYLETETTAASITTTPAAVVVESKEDSAQNTGIITSVNGLEKPINEPITKDLTSKPHPVNSIKGNQTVIKTSAVTPKINKAIRHPHYKVSDRSNHRTVAVTIRKGAPSTKSKTNLLTLMEMNRLLATSPRSVSFSKPVTVYPDESLMGPKSRTVAKVTPVTEYYEESLMLKQSSSMTNPPSHLKRPISREDKKTTRPNRVAKSNLGTNVTLKKPIHKRSKLSYSKPKSINKSYRVKIKRLGSEDVNKNKLSNPKINQRLSKKLPFVINKNKPVKPSNNLHYSPLAVKTTVSKRPKIDKSYRHEKHVVNKKGLPPQKTKRKAGARKRITGLMPIHIESGTLPYKLPNEGHSVRKAFSTEPVDSVRYKIVLTTNGDRRFIPFSTPIIQHQSVVKGACVWKTC